MHTTKLRTDVVRNHASTLTPSSQCKHDNFYQLLGHTSTTTLLVNQPSENTVLSKNLRGINSTTEYLTTNRFFQDCFQYFLQNI